MGSLGSAGGSWKVRTKKHPWGSAVRAVAESCPPWGCKSQFGSSFYPNHRIMQDFKATFGNRAGGWIDLGLGIVRVGC